MHFEDFGFHPSLLRGIRSLGFSMPTAIQARAIPLVMQGKDVIAVARAGAGKTAAFVLPVSHLLRQGRRGSLRALVISPTRDVAEQTCAFLNRLGASANLQSTAIFSEVPMVQQTRDLRENPDIIVACPGRLLDYLWKGTLSLSDLKILIIDEADQLYDLGMLPDIHNILACIQNPRQTLIFSATLPANLKRLANEILHDPVIVQNDR